MVKITKIGKIGELILESYFRRSDIWLAGIPDREKRRNSAEKIQNQENFQFEGHEFGDPEGGLVLH